MERFVDYLRWLGKRRGLTGLEVWWDQRRLTGTTELGHRIERDLGRTALLVVLHSENYRKSKYCEKELGWFVTAAKSHPLGLAVNGERRIFNINKISHEKWTDSSHWTQPLAGTLGFRFHDAAGDGDAFGDPIIARATMRLCGPLSMPQCACSNRFRPPKTTRCRCRPTGPLVSATRDPDRRRTG